MCFSGQHIHKFSYKKHCSDHVSQHIKIRTVSWCNHSKQKPPTERPLSCSTTDLYLYVFIIHAVVPFLLKTPLNKRQMLTSTHCKIFLLEISDILLQILKVCINAVDWFSFLFSNVCYLMSACLSVVLSEKCTKSSAKYSVTVPASNEGKQKRAKAKSTYSFFQSHLFSRTNFFFLVILQNNYQIERVSALVAINSHHVLLIINYVYNICFALVNDSFIVRKQHLLLQYKMIHTSCETCEYFSLDMESSFFNWRMVSSAFPLWKRKRIFLKSYTEKILGKVSNCCQVIQKNLFFRSTLSGILWCPDDQCDCKESLTLCISTQGHVPLISVITDI